jgi:epoxyqueuosine reductase
VAKNTCVINEDLGSWLFLAVIVTSLPLPPSGGTAGGPVPDLCGNCTLCIDACPTQALVEPYVMDARRCISYLTIELRDSIPAEFREAMGWQVFGCDICQDVCPWNRTTSAGPLAAFTPRPNLLAPELLWLLSLDEAEFREKFRGSAVRRTKWRGLIRNACVAAGNSAASRSGEPFEQLRARLGQLAQSDDALIAEHAQWALAQFSQAVNPGPAAPPIASHKDARQGIPELSNE